MAIDVQVTCTKKDGPDFDRRIDGIGGVNPSGSRWYMTEDDAIRDMESGKYTFYTVSNGVRANVLIRTHPTSRRKYLTTSPDGIRPNNLLLLPDCF